MQTQYLLEFIRLDIKGKEDEKRIMLKMSDNKQAENMQIQISTLQALLQKLEDIVTFNEE